MASAKDPPPPPDVFVDRVLTARRDLSSGTATIRVETAEDSVSPGYKDIRYRIETTFSPTAVKSIVHWIYGDRTEVYKFVRTPDKFIESVPGNEVPVLVTSPLTHRQSLGLFRFEMLGFYPHECLSLGQFQLRDLFHKHKWDAGAIAEDGRFHNCYRYDRSRKQGATDTRLVVWADPQQNYAVRKIAASVVDAQSNTTALEQTVVIENKRYRETNTWYPERVRYTRLNGGRLVADETAVVESLVLGEVDADSFSIQALDIEVNRKVHSSTEKGTRGQFWDGKSLVDVPVVNDDGRSARFKKTALVTLFVVSGLALLVGWAVLRYVRSRAHARLGMDGRTANA